MPGVLEIPDAYSLHILEHNILLSGFSSGLEPRAGLASHVLVASSECSRHIGADATEQRAHELEKARAGIEEHGGRILISLHPASPAGRDEAKVARSIILNVYMGNRQNIPRLYPLPDISRA